MKAKSIDVSKLGFKYKGKLIRTIRLTSVIRSGSKHNWVQGPTMIWINGKRVPTIEGYKAARKVFKKISENYKKKKEHTL